MRYSLLGLWLVALPLFAAENTVSFRNDREGESYYSNNSNKRAMERATRDIDESTILRAFDETLENQTASKLCSYDINQTFLKKLRAFNPKFDELPGAIYFLRSQDEMDDVVAGMLLDANKVKTTTIYARNDDERPYIPAKKILTEALKIVANFDKKYAKSVCFDEAYRTMVSDIIKIDKSVKASYLEGIFFKAQEQKKISSATYVALEQARQNEVESGGLTLKAYYQKISSLRLQYPLRDRNERSTFVTEKVDKMKMSNRQRLMETYTDIQIMMMGNIIKKLRTRLESPKVEILIYDRSEGTETITLEPMERFRLAIKLLRKEMSLLALNTYFGGRTPSYIDLMTASYEVGIIPATELEELAGLQDIWNPKKTFWEKAKVWVQTLSTVATIVIPPPYGFIPALAIVVIEATTEKSKDPNQNDPTSLF